MLSCPSLDPKLVVISVKENANFTENSRVGKLANILSADQQEMSMILQAN